MNDLSKIDYYKILEVSENATNEEIRKAYKKLAIKWHPDKNPDNKKEAEEKFKSISEAYSILSNPEKRKEYEEYRNNGFEGEFDFKEFNFNDPFEIFNNFFGMGFSDLIFENDLFDDDEEDDFGNFYENIGFFNKGIKKDNERKGRNKNNNNVSKTVRKSEKIINGKKISKVETITIDKNGNKKIEVREFTNDMNKNKRDNENKLINDKKENINESNSKEIIKYNNNNDNYKFEDDDDSYDIDEEDLFDFIPFDLDEDFDLGNNKINKYKHFKKNKGHSHHKFNKNLHLHNDKQKRNNLKKNN